MRIAFSSAAATWLLVVGVVAASSGIAQKGTAVFIQDDFLDAAARDTLLAGEPVEATDGDYYKHLRVPASLSERVMTALGRFVPGARHATASQEMLLPFTEHVGDEPEHQDHHRDGEHRGHMAEGRVGGVYLEGEGDFVFTNTATGAEERVTIAPGKMISWPNTGFRHRVGGAWVDAAPSLVGTHGAGRGEWCYGWGGLS